MPKTYAEIIVDARDLLQDSLAPYRYTDKTLLDALNRAIREIGRIRPDAFWDRFDESTGDIVVPEVVLTDSDPDDDTEEIDFDEDSQVATTDEIDFGSEYVSALIYYIVASAEIRDDEYTDDGRASMLMAQFKQQLVSL